MAACLQTLQDQGVIKRTCVLCCHPCEIECFGSCNHPVCYKCMTKLRILCQDNYCPVCRSCLEKVVYTDRVQPFEELDINSMHQCKTLPGLYFVSSESLYLCQQLLVHRCQICITKPTFKNFNNFLGHMKDTHKRYFCYLCIKHLKLFTHERRLYSKPDLNIHLKRGDSDNKSYKGHPVCKFCKKHYFDDDDLYLHLHNDHFSCHFCPADEYYDNYESLRAHFKSNHFLCEYDACADEKFVNAFSTDIDYKAHLALKHKHLLNRAEERRIRHIDIDLTYSRSNDSRTTGKNRRGDTYDRSQVTDDDFVREETKDSQEAVSLTGDYEDEFPSLFNKVSKNSGFLTDHLGASTNYTSAVKESRIDRNHNRSVPQRTTQQKTAYQKAVNIGNSLVSEEDFPSLTTTSSTGNRTGLHRQNASSSNWKSLTYDHKAAFKQNQNSGHEVKKNVPQKVGKLLEDFPSLPTKTAVKNPNFMNDFNKPNATKSSWGKSSIPNSADRNISDSSKYDQKESSNALTGSKALTNSKKASKSKGKKKSNSMSNSADNCISNHNQKGKASTKNEEKYVNKSFVHPTNSSVTTASEEDFPSLPLSQKPPDPFFRHESHSEYTGIAPAIDRPKYQDNYDYLSAGKTTKGISTSSAQSCSDTASANFSTEDFPGLPQKDKVKYAWLDKEQKVKAQKSQWKVPSNDSSKSSVDAKSIQQTLDTAASVRPPPGIGVALPDQDNSLSAEIGDDAFINDLLRASDNQAMKNNVKKVIKPPPGLDISNVTDSNISKITGLMANSSVSNVKEDMKYAPPIDAKKRGTDLLSLISKNLKSNQKLNDFKRMSADYRKSNLSTAKFYTHCHELFGNYFYQILPEMVALMPDIKQQNDLFKVWCDSIDHIKSRKKIWRAVKEEDDIDLDSICSCLPCPNCGQIVIESDFDNHIVNHSNFITG